jgi:hypothetical protein
MSDAAIFIGFFGGIFVLRIVAATVVFCWLLPRGDRCPNCDAVTLRVQSPVWNRLVPWLRTSWCPECNWDGMLRHGPLTPAPPTATPSLPPVKAARKRETG